MVCGKTYRFNLGPSTKNPNRFFLLIVVPDYLNIITITINIYISKGTNISWIFI